MQVVSTAFAGTPANTENTASLAATFGRLSSTRAHGPLGRFVYCPFIPSAGQRSTIDAWLEEVTL